MEKGPACPVRRPPPMMSLVSPMRRLKKTSVLATVPELEEFRALQEELPSSRDKKG